MKTKPTMQNLDRGVKNHWCPGCGNFGILTALKMAIVELQIPRENFVLCSGIGCSSKMPYWLNTIGFNSIHGRGIPTAEGIKLANHKLTVVSAGGDGDGFGEGVQHFIHACKRNIDITYIVHDNQIYSLTKGQTSPTSAEGFVTNTTPDGNIEVAFNPIAVALSARASFISRGFAGDIPHLKWLITEAIKHRGFALVEVLDPCVTMNKVNTFEFWKKRIYKLQEQGHDIYNKEAAFQKSLEFGDRVPIGIFYREERHTYADKVFALKDGKRLVDYPINNVDISENMEGHV